MENGRDDNNNKIGEGKNEVHGVKDERNGTGMIKINKNRENKKTGKTDKDGLDSNGPLRNGVEE